MKTIYFDNAATSNFKPKCVKHAFLKALKNSANPGRGAHHKSIENASLVWKVREKVCKHFGAKNPQNVVFTKNCTEALNVAILGLAKQFLHGHVVTTCFEHNSVLRPLFELEKQGLLTLSIAKPENKKSISRKDIEKCIKPNTFLVCVGAFCNVNGAENNICEIGQMCKEKGILFLVDFAQGAGHAKIDMASCNINFLAFSGHKGFFTPQGIGALVIDSKILPLPILFGGTGTQSISTLQPNSAPECFESGTIATPLIACVGAGIDFAEKNFAKNSKKIEDLTKFAHKKLSNFSQLKLFSTPKNKCGIVSFVIDECSSSVVCDFVDQKFGICVRGGLHCAPLAHKFFGTSKQGMVRASFGATNTKKQVKILVKAIGLFLKSLKNQK